MNESMREYVDYIINAPDKYECICNLDEKLLIFKVIDPCYPILHNSYVFLIWDEKEKGYINSTSEIEVFCKTHLSGVDLIRKFAAKAFKMNSSGIKGMDYTVSN